MDAREGGRGGGGAKWMRRSGTCSARARATRRRSASSGTQWKDRKKKVEWPLFPGYCFARFTLADRVRVLEVAGVAELIGANGRAEAVPEAEIDGIRRRVASRSTYDPHPFLETGMEMEVVRGPLAGVRGRLLRKDRSTRLLVGVTLIHQADRRAPRHSPGQNPVQSGSAG